MNDVGHFWISITKSIFRIAGCIFGINGNINTFIILLLLAEVLGILEEVVDKR